MKISDNAIPKVNIEDINFKDCYQFYKTNFGYVDLEVKNGKLTSISFGFNEK